MTHGSAAAPEGQRLWEPHHKSTKEKKSNKRQLCGPPDGAPTSVPYVAHSHVESVKFMSGSRTLALRTMD